MFGTRLIEAKQRRIALNEGEALASALEVPLRERNTLLLAAGFALPTRRPT